MITSVPIEDRKKTNLLDMSLHCLSMKPIQLFSSAMFSLIAAPSSLFTHQRSALLQGAVMVAPNVTLDRETTPVYTLTVNATDNVMGPGIKRSTVVSVSVIKSLLGQPNYFRHVCSGY